jgi:hypothetical protein
MAKLSSPLLLTRTAPARPRIAGISGRKARTMLSHLVRLQPFLSPKLLPNRLSVVHEQDTAITTHTAHMLYP